MEARTIAIELWRLGYAVVCPHTNTALMDGILPGSVWLEGDLEILSRCDLIVMSPRYQESMGARKELVFARQSNIPVFLWPEDRDGLVEFAKDIAKVH